LKGFLSSIFINFSLSLLSEYGRLAIHMINLRFDAIYLRIVLIKLIAASSLGCRARPCDTPCVSTLCLLASWATLLLDTEPGVFSGALSGCSEISSWKKLINLVNWDCKHFFESSCFYLVIVQLYILDAKPFNVATSLICLLINYLQFACELCKDIVIKIGSFSSDEGG